MYGADFRIIQSGQDSPTPTIPESLQLFIEDLKVELENTAEWLR